MPTRTVQSAAERAAHEIFQVEVAAALVELAKHYQIDVVRWGPVTDPAAIVGHQVAGIIGFAGEGFGGTLAIRAPSMVVRSCLPVADAGPEPHVLGDWIAELANQLLGRTKNKLIRYHSTFQITPPTYAVADELLVIGCDRGRTSWLSVTTHAGPLLVMVELHVAPDFTFVAASDPNDATLVHAEGELMLF
ncbi:MAG: chemotaxis protein CheX [Deltaproteobacteria bacterium]|nr:chemotaxis protein CheX [Nannocystaceae bacterium]